jgi:hypothetical protein
MQLDPLGDSGSHRTGTEIRVTSRSKPRGVAGAFSSTVARSARRMQISEAAQVIEVRDYIEVNSKLGQGWKLLAVIPGSNGSSGKTYVIYVLGKAKPGLG